MSQPTCCGALESGCKLLGKETILYVVTSML